MRHKFKVFLSILILLMHNYAANAGDAALKRIMGFSPDGRYFAFEQYGIQDGSGFPYVEIFFIDTKKNSWINDAPPIRETIKDETASLSKLRAAAIRKATPFIKKYATTLHGFTLVSNPITQLDAPKYSAHFGIHPSAPTLNQYKMQLTLKNASSAKCKQYSNQPAKIFSLSLTSVKLNQTVQTYNDSNLPTSRNCPLDYSISDIHYFEAVNGDVIFMAFINIIGQSFEGADRRFMVIPFFITK